MSRQNLYDTNTYMGALRTASVEVRLAPIQAQLDGLTASLPWWQRALFRLAVMVVRVRGQR